MIKVLVADDHQLIRESLKIFLDKSMKINVVASLCDSVQVVEYLAENDKVDVLLTDMHMPGMSVVSMLRKIRSISSELKIIMFTAEKQIDSIVKTLNMGVDGYILKDTDKKEITQAIEEVHKGGSYFSLEVSKLLAKSYQPEKRVGKNKGLLLSNREKEILVLTGEGYTNHEIAQQLNISFRTVDTHKRNMIKKTGAKNMTHLVKIDLELKNNET